MKLQPQSIVSPPPCWETHLGPDLRKIRGVECKHKLVIRRLSIAIKSYTCPTIRIYLAQLSLPWAKNDSLRYHDALIVSNALRYSWASYENLSGLAFDLGYDSQGPWRINKPIIVTEHTQLEKCKMAVGMRRKGKRRYVGLGVQHCCLAWSKAYWRQNPAPEKERYTSLIFAALYILATNCPILYFTKCLNTFVRHSVEHDKESICLRERPCQREAST